MSIDEARREELRVRAGGPGGSGGGGGVPSGYDGGGGLPGNQIADAAYKVAVEADQRGRAFIVYAIVTTFCLSVIASLVYVVWSYNILSQPFMMSGEIPERNFERWIRVISIVKDVLTGTLLPIITLIIGYYFGRAQGELAARKH